MIEDHLIGTDISIVIAAHNAAEYLGEQLDALASQSCELAWEVVVVDNNSTDQTATIALAYRNRLDIRVVDASNGRGAGYARNVGVQTTTSAWIVFIDADDVVAESWLTNMARALGHHAFVAGPTELDQLNEPWVADSRGRNFAQQATMFLNIFPYASSCNVGIHRNAFDRVNGFDEEFFKGQDLELSLRLWQANIKLHFEPGAVVHYRLRSSLADIFMQNRQYGAVQPVILERLRAQGVKTPSRLSQAKTWAWLLLNAGLLRTKAGRARWLWVAGGQVGRFRGGLGVRRLYL